MSILGRYAYTYDKRGRIIEVEESNGRSISYTYDAADRLITEHMINGSGSTRTISYTYDAVGNRLSRDDSSGGLTTYSYDDNDRLVAEAIAGIVTTYAYDDNGNVLSATQNSGDVTTYAWDFHDRLLQVEFTTAGATDVVEYGYDVNGNRILRRQGGVETRYLIDTNREHAQVVEEYDPSRAPLVSYTYGRERIARNDGSGIVYYLEDIHSGVRNLADESGDVLAAYTYDAFGALIEESGSSENEFLYRSEQRDAATGHDYLRARYLDTESGRFLSLDKLAVDPATFSAWNAYSYVDADPINRHDPSGNEAITILGTSVALLIAGHIIAAVPIAIKSTQVGEDGLEWTGRGGTFAADFVLFGVTGSIFEMHACDASVVSRGVCTRASYYVLDFGVGIGITGAFGFSDVNLKSDPANEADPYELTGFVSRWGGSLGLGPASVSYNAFKMGGGVGTITSGSAESVGEFFLSLFYVSGALDFGAIGFSAMNHVFNDREPCSQVDTT